MARAKAKRFTALFGKGVASGSGGVDDLCSVENFPSAGEREVLFASGAMRA